MATMSFADGLKALQRRPIRERIWMLVTESPLIIPQVAHALLDAVVPEHRDFNYQTLDCRSDMGVGACEALCEDLPMMAERRLVWLRDVKKLGMEATGGLTEYLPNLPETTVLFMSTAPPGEERPPAKGSGEADTGAPKVKSGLKELIAAAAALGVVLQKPPGKPEVHRDEAQRWVEQEIKARGLRAARGFSKHLVDRVGDDLAVLDTELEKLICFVGESGEARAQDIDAICASNPAQDEWALQNALDEHDGSAALEALHRRLEADVHPLQILAGLGAHFRKLLMMKSLHNRGDSPAAIATRLKRNAWGVEKSLKATAKFSERDFEKILDTILRADQAIKSGKNGILILEMLLIGLCR